MKKLILIGIVAAMVMGLSVAASALAFTSNDKLLIGMKAEYLGNTQAACTYGTQALSLDAFDATDSGHSPKANGVGEIICIDLGVAGTVTDGRWAVDKRAPLTGLSQSKLWSLKAYVNPVGSGNLVIKAWVVSTGKITSTDFGAKLYEGVGTGGLLLWTAPFNLSGTASAPQFTSSSYNVGEGYQMFTLQIFTIPEPGSMIAMLTGLVGLVGFGIRRRK